MGSVGDSVQDVSTMAKKAISLGSVMSILYTHFINMFFLYF